MTLLVDSQLPIALARFLTANGCECTHVLDIGMEAAEDRAIWAYARERGMTIVTKDEDFHALAIRQGSIPPQVVWVRLGNCRKAELLNAFARILPALVDSLAVGEAVIEIR